MTELSEETVRYWGTRDVALWLQEIGFKSSVQDFRHNRIDGAALLNMSISQLRAFPSLSDARRRDDLKGHITKLPGSALGRSGLNRKGSRAGDKKKRVSHQPRDSKSPTPPPLPQRPQPQVNSDHHHQQQYDQDEDEYSFDEDDSFDSDSDFYDEEDTGNNNNNNQGMLAQPRQPAAQSHDSIRKLQAKFMAFGLGGMDNQQVSIAEQQYLDNEDDDQDVYDVPPEFQQQHQYYMPPVEDDDEGDIYDVPPEEAQGHFPPPTKQNFPAKNYPSSPQPVTKFPQLRAPIKQTDKASSSVGTANTQPQHNPPKTSSNISDRMKAFQNNANDTTKNIPGKPGKPFQSAEESSPKLPTKFPKSPQLPPKNQPMVPQNNEEEDENNDNDEGDLSNIPAHLRDRFKRSKRQSRIRKQSRGQEDSPRLSDSREPAAELPSQQKSAIANNPFLQNQAPKSCEVPSRFGKPQDKPDNPSSSDNAAKSVKDRMKMFSSSSVDEPPPKSPAQKWPPGNSFDRKPPGVPTGRPPMEDPPKQKLPPRIPENRNPVIPNGKEFSAAPPLPDRNTKPPKFGGAKPAPDIGKRPPMPLPPASYDDEENYDPPTVHAPQEIIEENYDPPQFHREEIIEENYDPPQLHEEIQEDTYDPPPLPNKIPGFAASKQPRFPPKEDRRVTEPALPPRPPKSNFFMKGPPSSTTHPVLPPTDPVPGGRRNTFATPAKPPMEKPAQKPSQSASVNPLESYPWYHGEIDRRTTESALEKDNIDGCFIVRDPSKADEKRLGFYSLSIWHCGKTRHLRIRCRSDKRYVVGESKEDERPFDSVAELIRYHKKTPLLLKSGGSTVLTCLPTSLA